MQFTEEQKLAINIKDSNLLVSAGAGSGKTAVLVERIVDRVINYGIDIDKILVVTFTNSAASEMRERLASRLYKESLTNHSLRKQIMLLSKANICTIDSFCLKIVKDNFFKLGIDPNFRIAEGAESELLKLETLEELLEQYYDDENDALMSIVNEYSSNKDDENIRNIILKIYSFTRCAVDTKKWLDDKIDEFNIDNIDNSIFCKLIIDYSKKQIKNAINELKVLLDDIGDSELAGKYISVISEDLKNLQYLYTKTNGWDELKNAIDSFEFARASGARNVPEELKEYINEVRDNVKDTIKNEIKDKFFIFNSDDIKLDYEIIYKNLLNFKKIVNDFSDMFYQKKLEKNVLDFSDIEHLALNTLLNNKEIADNYKNNFFEIMIDEYQDSNMLQELILTSISKNNIFMVGDVKQSIYKFRLARPELFLEKYFSYSLVSPLTKTDEQDNKKVLLYKNFRSNQNVINQVNYIFEKLMSKEIGGLDYTDDEFLKFGADYYAQNDDKAELILIENQKVDDSLEEFEENILDSKASLEGKYIAQRIKSMVGKIDVYDKEISSYRKAKYKDFVILLRNTVGRVEYILEELNNLNIPSYADNTGDYFNNIEVQTILSVLRIIDNPIQDIPLVAVLRSQIGNFSVDELSRIRLVDKNVSFYEAMIMTINMNNDLALKVSNFLDLLHSWREKSKYTSIWELLWEIYNESGYYYYVSLFPDGIKRQSNLNLLLERAEKYEKSSFKGLFNFLNYIDNIKTSTNDFSESKMVGENDDVVRIMSVHKSKGLEFPVVFLAGTDKSFVKNETKENIMLDYDIGFGMDVIDYKSRIKYASISKHAISIQDKQDSLSEEMRILYVALTRAREKIIVTGIVPDIEKSIVKYSGSITRYKLFNSKSLLDWIAIAILNKTNLWDVKKVYARELLNNTSKEIATENKNCTNVNQELINMIDEQMKWKYKYISSTKLPNKVSISEVKRRKMLEEQENKLFNNILLNDMPDFAEDGQLAGTKFGTVIHEIMEQIDFKNYDLSLLDGILNQFDISENIKKTIIYKIEQFTKIDLFKELTTAKQIEKEKPFNYNIQAKEIYDIDSDETVMIQGIIDLYFINASDELILVDYKTDNVDKIEDLVNKYRIQLELYKMALEDILGRKVVKTIIYSFKFGSEINIE